ncbi:MAG TPA: MarR family transcriptional regulator [Ramlibacter sp.]|nr:MarR family transcriptional regulator [Ramlibacter sp.]
MPRAASSRSTAPAPRKKPVLGEGRRAARRHQSLLATGQSPYYQVWVLTNLTAKPFAALFGARFHLNLTEWRIMLTLADRPGASAQELSDYTGLDKMSVSRVVRSLEAQGRLEREGSEEDRRKRHLFLTEAGWKVYEAIAAGALAREQQIYASLTEAELRTLHRLLMKLSDKAREPLTS